MMFAKDGYQPGELCQILLEVDNTQCQADITSISVRVQNNVTMRSQGHATGDGRCIFSKSINGVPAGMAYVGDQAIREQFQMPSGP